MPTWITTPELVDRYPIFFLDAWGVLMDDAGPRPDAAAFIATLREAGARLAVLSNDASATPDRLAGKLATVGVRPDEIVNGARLIAAAVTQRGLTQKRCLVLGTDDAHANVAASGALPVRPDELADSDDFEAVILCSEEGYAFPRAIEALVTSLFMKLDRGERVPLLLANPDIIAPTSPRSWGVAAGAMAALLEAALRQRYPLASHAFEPLGKPAALAFETARAITGDGAAVMIGDQIRTDIVGANRAGLDSALLSESEPPPFTTDDGTPTWLLRRL